MKKKLNCILLVDDDEPTNFIYKMIVGGANCTEKIKITQSGHEALNYLTASMNNNTEAGYMLPELIFLDINMPRMDGWDFMEKYNELRKNQNNNPVIMMLSTSLNPDDEIKAKSTPGISAFMHKPLTTQMLNEVLKTYFPDYL
jgi:CheY-like chemotaxis protein